MSPPGVWAVRAACRTSPDLWHANNGEHLGTARHVCITHCPVRDLCSLWAAGQRWSSACAAGVIYDRDGSVDREQPTAAGCGMCGLDPQDIRRRQWRESARRVRARAVGAPP